ncbi:uncharacterized protein [Arachis hypogaea]|uniref:uncharacterized protein n=1 Tax=Arachis hypogaea TaxID=3818 RepID=UPI003B21FD1A
MRTTTKPGSAKPLLASKQIGFKNHITTGSMPRKFNSVEEQVTEKVSQDFEEWEKRDECLIAWMLLAMDESFVNKVVKYEYAFKIWEVLEEHFVARMKSKVKLLKAQLKTVKKHGSSVSEFITKINKVANFLSAIGAPLTKDEYFECTLGGLDEEFSAFITMVNARSDHMSINDLE